MSEGAFALRPFERGRVYHSAHDGRIRSVAEGEGGTERRTAHAGVVLRQGGKAERLSPPANVQINPSQGSAARRPQTRLLYAALGMLSLAGLASLLLATRWGIGIDYDSVAYIATARYFLSGHDYPTWLYPATHWPPLLPGALAAIGALRLDPEFGARWLNACLFAANIALVGAMVARYAGGLGWSALLASFLMLASQDMLLIHSMAWSEPLFIFLVLLAILMLAEYLDRASFGLLAASAGMTACAFLTRYLGGTLVVAGAVALIVLGHRPLWRRVVDAAFFGTVGAVPAVLWVLQGARGVGGAADRVVASHPVTVADLLFGLQTASAWLIPKRVPDRAILFLVVVVVTGVAAAISSARPPRRRWLAQEGGRDRVFAALPPLLSIFVIAYVGLLLAAISFVDMAILNERTLSPVFVAMLILLFCIAAGRWKDGQFSRPLRLALILLVIYVAALSTFRATSYVLGAYRDGLGTGRPEWRRSELVRRVKGLPPGVLVYSNLPDAIYILTGRPVAFIPPKVDPVSGLRNPAYASQFLAMKHDLEGGRAVLVLLTLLDYERGADHSSRVSELRSGLPLAVVDRTYDGEIYRLQGVRIAGLQ